MVPEGWEKTKLGKLVEINSGVAPSLLSLSDTGRYPYVKVEDMNNCNKYQTLSRTYTDDEGKKVGAGAILFPKRGAAIMNNKVRVAATDLYLDSNMMALLPNEGVSSEFLFYSLIREKLYRIADTSTIPQINNKHINPYPFLLPPLPEQKKIAQILSTWDQAITATERLLENSQQRKKGLMQQLLTGKKRLPGFEGEWRTVELGSLGSTYSGLSGKTKEDFGTGEPFVTYMGVFSDSAIKTDRFDYVRLSEGESQNKVQYGDILFTTSSETPEEVGMASVLLEHLPYNLYLNSFCFGFRPSSFEELVPEYARYVFRGEEMRRRISALAQGATRYNLSKKQLVKLDILLPGKAEQEAISQVLATSDMEISAVRHRLFYLREEKKALMQQLLTGKRRVNVETEAA